MSDTSPNNQELITKVANWLDKEGYPLEYETANIFAKHDFCAHQGEHVRDMETSSAREIDVVADASVDVGHSLLRISHVVECKYSRDKPWVVFLSPRSMATAACITQTLANDAGTAIMWAIAGDKRLQGLGLFDTPNYPGHGGRQVFSKNNDIVYETLQSVASKSLLKLEEYDRDRENVLDAIDSVVVAFPILVVDGVLYKAYYNEEKAGMEIVETECVRLHWRGAERYRLHSTIDIVSRRFLETLVKQRTEEVETLINVMEEKITELHKCVEKRSMRHFNITEGSRGVVGTPPLVYELDRWLSSQTAKTSKKRAKRKISRERGT